MISILLQVASVPNKLHILAIVLGIHPPNDFFCKRSTSFSTIAKPWGCLFFSKNELVKCIPGSANLSVDHPAQSWFEGLAFWASQLVDTWPPWLLPASKNAQHFRS